METVKLNGHIDAHGETLSEVTLRKPTVEDINRVGMPYDINPENGLIVTNTKVVSDYIARLGQIPPSSVKQLEPTDWMVLWGVVMGFFGTAPGT